MSEKLEIVFLGTGSSIPTEKRNHTGILIRYASENILVDCGEGIQRQFRKAKLNPCKLTKLLITHWHADHTLGIPGLLETLAMSEYSKTLEIYGPKGTADKIKLFEKIYGKFKVKTKIKEIKNKVFENDYLLIESEEMKHGIKTLAYSIKIKDKIKIDKNKLKKLKLPNSPLLKELKKGKDVTLKGKKIKAKSLTYIEKGKKITIILDTALNKNAIKLAKNSDLLISEASFLSDEEKKAKEYNHLTARQAAEIAKKAKAKKLILTHNSQRYEKNTAPILQEAKKVFKNVIFPEDLDKITL